MKDVWVNIVRSIVHCSPGLTRVKSADMAESIMLDIHLKLSIIQRFLPKIRMG